MWEFTFADLLVLVPPSSGDLYIVNASGAYAWGLFRAGKTPLEAIRQFAAYYDIPVDIAAHDLNLTWKEWERTLFAPAPSAFPVSLPLPPREHVDDGSFSSVYNLDGKNIRVILDAGDLIAEISPRLEPLLASPSACPDATLRATYSADTYNVFSDAGWVCSRHHPADARVAFLQEFVRVAQGTPTWAAILHAGACGTEHRCVVFPAASHSGKTTLAAALMHAGMMFYADDSVALHHNSLDVASMPFALMMREGSWPAVSARFPEFKNNRVYLRFGETVRFLAPSRPASNKSASAAAIVFARWESGAGTAIQSLSAAETLMRLNESGFWVAPHRDTIQNVLHWLQSLPSFEMIYSDLDDATAFVRALLAD